MMSRKYNATCVRRITMQKRRSGMSVTLSIMTGRRRDICKTPSITVGATTTVRRVLTLAGPKRRKIRRDSAAVGQSRLEKSRACGCDGQKKRCAADSNSRHTIAP